MTLESAPGNRLCVKLGGKQCEDHAIAFPRISTHSNAGVEIYSYNVGSSGFCILRGLSDRGGGRGRAIRQQADMPVPRKVKNPELPWNLDLE